ANFIHPKDREIFHGRFRAFHHSPEGKSMEIRLDCKDHSVCYALLEGRAIKEAQGSDLLLLTISDITARRDAEANLRLADKIIQSAQESILVTDKHGKIINVNPCFEEITGYSKDEVVGKNPSMLQSGRQSSAFYDVMWKELLDAGVWQGTVWNKRKNGDEYAERLTINAIYGEQYKEVTHFVGVFTDITDQLALEEQLRQSQKMEAIGTLVGGIAHDFNNMLAGIIGNLYLAKKQTLHLPEVTEKLDHINHLSDKAAKMISQMLTFARKGIVQMKPTSLNASVANILHEVGHVTVPENIHLILDFDIDKTDLVVNADQTQLQQVIINLLSNACDGLIDQKNPEITVSLDRYEADDNFFLKHELVGSKQFSHLVVSDNGCGIAEDKQPHIFEPFFTTKEVGKGTGLGLAMVYGSIQTHDGVITVDSKLNKGTDFHIYLPLIETKAESPAELNDSFIHGNGETILVVDDNEVVRSITSETLCEYNYQTHQACDGLDAFELFKEKLNEIDLVMLDIVMPQMGGGEVALKMRQLRPDIPILFMTGYDKEHVLKEHDQFERSEIITKPFQFNILSQVLRTLLD
ncbi:MAG: PAS domain S-box protein, partial [Mariprofundaceae bacterium]